MKIFKFIFGALLMSTMVNGQLKLSSSDIENNKAINIKFTCDGENKTPELNWSGVPEGTKSFVLICDDPDAPRAESFVHWVVYNIPSDVNNIGSQLERKDKLQNGTMQGVNDFGKIGWDGPCPPPSDKAHRYYFKLYALNSLINLDAGKTKKEVEKAMAGHILEQKEIVGLYQRAK